VQAPDPEDLVRHWIAVGLSTAAADRPRAEAAVRDAYRRAGLAPPERVAWCGSPLALLLARGEVPADPARIPAAVRAAARAAAAAVRGVDPGLPVLRRVHGEPLAAADRALAADLPPGLPDRLSREVGAAVDRRVGFAVAFPILFAAEEALGIAVEDVAFGQHDAGRLAVPDLLAAGGRRREVAPLGGLLEVARHAGWWSPRERVCWIAERPELLRFGDEGRLHAEGGPAVRFPDGWEIHARDGIVVPAEEPRRAPRFHPVGGGD
jgi:hypothetical protein